MLTFPSIVAVHGLNGDAFKTWTTKNTKKFWLGDADLLPANPKRTRVLTFSYNAAVTALFGKTSSDRILQHAHNLVAELVADREVRSCFRMAPVEMLNPLIQLEDAMERPILFVCHSLGGIIVKRVRQQ